jgi:two-component system LytT family response regulator
MEQIKIIHIDDEANTLLFSKSIFLQNDSIQYSGGFTNAKDAIAFLKAEKIDIIFCDIEMPNYNGLWLANNLPYDVPIVFITAHSGFAIEAFDACALHYLMKPLSLQHLNDVIERFKKQGFQQTSLKEQISQFYNQYLPQNITNHPNRIYINSVGKIIIVNLQNLMYLIGAGPYTKFFMQNGDIHTSSKILKTYEDSIQFHPDFIRIHRSYLINKNFVKQILKTSKEQWFIEMENNEKLELSRRRTDEVLIKLQR